jgi:hypothetical protein
MKIRSAVLSLTVLLLLGTHARPAHANVDRMVMQRVVVMQVLSACALQMTLLSVVNNQTNGNEAVLVGGTKVAGIAKVAAQGMALVNRPITVASPMFEAMTGTKADETISDSDCTKLVAGAKVEFRGSFGPIAGAATIPTGFGLNKAVLWDSGDQLVDLTIASIQLKTYLGLLIALGTGPLVGGTPAGGGSGGGGCSYAANGASAPAASLALIAGGLLLRRRRL